ncbi:MAG: hypothetical protein BGO51_22520 [Rhodospirillales bacterium 69-11]|jgi:hypothetical protein|nr:hypothetical protein [Rhodospirillales bacterium]MBN8928141.1 hypothetical protein [Rhodospirillales bacterium]OJW31303.1 MAG: hypothetical protein BGO51_22520 [Rhodospirillales bacterium 69-11]
MAPFGISDQRPTAQPAAENLRGAGGHTSLSSGVHAPLPSVLAARSASLSGRHPLHAEPIRAARGFTLGILVSLPVWAGAAALLWANL